MRTSALEFLDNLFIWQLILLSLVSTMLCALLIFCAQHSSHLAGSAQNLGAVQSAHHRPTARVGGVGVFLTVILSSAFLPEDLAQDYMHLLLATSFLFIVGLVEDLGIHISPAKRLLAAFVASLMVVLFLGAWIPRADISGLDHLLGYWWVGIPITLIFTAGIANSFNLIDGVNGLAGVTGMIASGAMAIIAHKAGFHDMSMLTAMLTVIILGFFVLNFPFGRIFLGDAGAYSIGFILSWLGVLILLNAPQVTPWALLLVLFWPVIDTCLAIYRRMRKTQNTMAPDRLHIHQLVMRGLEIHVLGRRKRNIANPLSTVVLFPFIALPACVGVILWDKPLAALLAVVIFTCLFCTFYILAFPLSRRLARKSCAC